MRTAWLSMAIVLAGLLVLPALESSPEAKQDVSVTTLAHRVEALRDLRFERLPVPSTVSASVARREGLEDLDRSYPATRRHADEAILRRRRAASGVWGEWATSELVGEEAAAGWGGDRYELWRGAGGDVLAMRWRWDASGAAREFLVAARERLKPTRVTASGDAVTLVWAPWALGSPARLGIP